jgi:hypothetical protein
MAPLHGGSSAGKLDLSCGHSLDVVGHPGLHQSGLMSICLAGCLSPGPRKNDLTIYWALGPFVRYFTLLVDPGDIYPPQAMTHSSSKSAGCRPGSTREQGRLSRSAGTSGRHGRANPRPEKYVICPRVSSTASPTTSGSGRHPHLVGSARTWLLQRCFSA